LRIRAPRLERTPTAQINAIASVCPVGADVRHTRIIRITFLAPDIIKAILEGNQPPGLTAATLLRDSRFPLDWQDQREALGFADEDRRRA
jgi:hypothetical protein